MKWAAAVILAATHLKAVTHAHARGWVVVVMVVIVVEVMVFVILDDVVVKIVVVLGF